MHHQTCQFGFSLSTLTGPTIVNIAITIEHLLAIYIEGNPLHDFIMSEL